LSEQQQFSQLLALPDDQLLQLFFLPSQVEPHEFAALIFKIQQLTAISHY
jgi:succinate dehydrogenase flavin-adding protein (antitoxin of CptAB toxin-antitoxin module)